MWSLTKPWQSDYTVEPGDQRIEHIRENLCIFAACACRDMKRMIGVRK